MVSKAMLTSNTQMQAVRFNVIKIIKEFVILHDCLSFSVFFHGDHIRHYTPFRIMSQAHAVSMVIIYISDGKVDKD